MQKRVKDLTFSCENRQFYRVRDKGSECAFFTFDANHLEESLVVYEIYVLSQYWRCGIGSCILDFVKEKAKEFNFRRVLVRTKALSDSMADIKVFYRKNGFKDTDKDENLMEFLVV